MRRAEFLDVLNIIWMPDNIAETAACHREELGKGSRDEDSALFQGILQEGLRIKIVIRLIN